MVYAALSAAALISTLLPSHAEDAASRHVYSTGGVHNDKDCDPPERCVYRRSAGEPTDPAYPAWWTSGWTMYRVFNNYDTFPPPYANPPSGLTPRDYEVSYGTSYYDSTYVPADKDGTGAMMEYYDKRCLPIFPFDNKFSCAFVSLGNKAYFLRYADRPPETQQCCQFSLKNHPPRVDFIKHLPYNAVESRHVGDSLQAYSYRVGGKLNILFGYAFDKAATPDAVDTAAAPYRHPQSFYFSGVPTDPPNAPIVSQNYTNFRMQRPDPEATWAQVARMCPAQPEWCCLFSTDCPARKLTQSARPPEWTDFTTPPRAPAALEEKKP